METQGFFDEFSNNALGNTNEKLQSRFEVATAKIFLNELLCSFPAIYIDIVIDVLLFYLNRPVLDK